MSATVFALGIVSLLNDVGGDAVTPLLPAFVATVGGGPEALGLIEGLADADTSLVQFGSGYLADRTGKQKGLALVGYAIANSRYSQSPPDGGRSSSSDSVTGSGKAFVVRRAMPCLRTRHRPRFAAVLSGCIAEWITWEHSSDRSSLTWCCLRDSASVLFLRARPSLARYALPCCPCL